MPFNDAAFNIIAKIESEIKNGRRLMGATLCNRAKLLELVDKLKKVLHEKEEEFIRKEQQLNVKLKEELARRIDSEEYVQEAKRKAELIVKQAEEEAEAIREWANNYVNKVFTALETELTKVLSKTRELRLKVNENITQNMGNSKPPLSHRKVRQKENSDRRANLVSAKS